MCVFWDLCAWHFSCWEICFSHVLHPSIILSSVASCFITFMYLYGFFVPPWSFLIIFMSLRWSFLTSCTLCQSWQKGGEFVENIWFFFFFLNILQVKGSAYLFLFVHRSCDHVYIHCAYLWWCMSSSPILICVISFLSLYTCFYLYAIYYFCFTQKFLDEFCLKCFKNTGCQSLLAINSLLTKFFKSLC